MADDILFTHSYFLRFDPKEFKAMMPYPPLGTLYAAAFLRANGFKVALADSMLAESEHYIAAALDQHSPRVLVIYDDDFNYLTKMCLTRMREAAFAMAAFAKQRAIPVVVHGSDAADHASEYIAHGADYVICGEGEQTLLELAQALLRGNGYAADISGLAFVEQGELRRTPARKVRQNLDALPFPAWDLVNVDNYRSTWQRKHGYFSANMVTTRGCPFHCNWCAKPIYGQVYNSRSPRNVVEEMQWLKATIKPDHLWFCDDIFGLKPGWVESFAEEVTAADAVMPFKCLARVDLLLKGDAINALQKAGCRSVWVGAESGSQQILDKMEKGTTVGQIYEATARLKRAGIQVGFFLQYGYPGETLEDIQLTTKMLRDCMPDEIGISVSYPLPGTKFYDTVKSQLGTKHNWVVSEDLDLMFPGTYPPDFYRTLHKVTHKRFRVWQTQKILRERFARPSRSSISDLRRIAAGLYHAVTLPSLMSEMEKLQSTPIRP